VDQLYPVDPFLPFCLLDLLALEGQGYLCLPSHQLGLVFLSAQEDPLIQMALYVQELPWGLQAQEDHLVQELHQVLLVQEVHLDQEDLSLQGNLLLLSCPHYPSCLAVLAILLPHLFQVLHPYLEGQAYPGNLGAQGFQQHLFHQLVLQGLEDQSFQVYHLFLDLL
jgi:hypothetical protein